MAQKKAFDKNFLIRALITKVCDDKILPDLKYPEQFYGEYWRLFKKLNERRTDLPSSEFLDKKYGYDRVQTELTIGDIIEELNFYYVEEQTTKIIQDILKDTKRSDYNTVEVFDKVGKEFTAVRQAITKAYTIDISKDADKVVEEYLRVASDGFAVPTGFEKLDDIVHLRTGYLVGICGGTGGGKTITMVKMAASAILAGVPSMYFSLEMGLSEMMNRILTVVEGMKDPEERRFSFKDLFYSRVSGDQYKEALDDIAGVQTHIITRQSEGKIDLQTIERYIVEHKPRVVFLDYLTLIDADTAWNAEESVTKVLKRIALQNQCLIIFGCQADTDAIKSGEIPGLTGVRGNKSFPYDCDVFIGLASKRYATDEDKMRIYYAVRKSRNGGFPEWSTKVNPNLGTWEDATGEPDPIAVSTK